MDDIWLLSINCGIVLCRSINHRLFYHLRVTWWHWPLLVYIVGCPLLSLPHHGFFGLVFLQQMRRIGIVQTTPTVRRSADRAAHSPPHLSLVVSGFFSVPIPIPLGHGIFFRFSRESLFLGFLQFSSCSCDLFWVSSRILEVVSRFSSARLYFPLSAVSFDRSFWFLDLFTSLVEFFSVFFSLHLIILLGFLPVPLLHSSFLSSRPRFYCSLLLRFL